MGNSYLTNFARFNDTVISVYEAELLQNQGYDLSGKLSCLECNRVMKFINWEHENYFAHVNTGDDIRKEHRGSSSENYIHKLTKLVIESKDYPYIMLGDCISVDSILSISSEKQIGEGKNIVRPDITIETIDCIYYVEVYNTSKVNANKQAKYKRLYKINDGKNFKVIEILVHDLEELSKTKSVNDIKDIILHRLVTNNDFVKVLDLSFKPRKKQEYEIAPFGRCYVCNEPYRLCANTESSDYSKAALCESIDTVRLVDTVAYKEYDKTELGVAMLHCPHCSERRYIQLHCPDCAKHGKSVPMRLLRNTKSGRYFLACYGYETMESASKTDRQSECNCTLTLFEEDGVKLSDELLAMKGFNNWQKTGSKNKKLQEVRYGRNNG